MRRGVSKALINKRINVEVHVHIYSNIILRRTSPTKTTTTKISTLI
jgi:hypothetical protein